MLHYAHESLFFNQASNLQNIVLLAKTDNVKQVKLMLI